MPACPKCQAEVAVGTKFCSECGTRLSLPPAPPRPPAKAPEGEHRNVVVLFAEIGGLETLTDTWDPEDVTDLVNRCFAALTRPVQELEGTIDKFIGQCVMVLFGAPAAHEDDAARAARAALRMQQALSELPEAARAKLSLSIGINSGPVVAGFVGTGARREYTVMGDAVNVAKRLQEAAGPGNVLISERTANLLRSGFETGGVLSVSAKGKSEMVAARRLLAERQAAGVRDGLDLAGLRFVPELVGREPEWRQLLQSADRVERGEGQWVRLVGEAGIGKSRLKHELRGELRRRGWPVREGRASGHRGAGALSPFVHLLSSWLDPEGKADQEQSERSSVELAAALGLSSGESARLRELMSSSGVLRPQTQVSEHQRMELFSAFRKLLIPPSGALPHAVLLEDWEGADPASEQLLDFIVQDIESFPVLVLSISRPVASRPMPRAPSLTINLGPLGQDAATGLVQQIVPPAAIPPEILQRLSDKCSGNPLFLVQILQSWASAGILSFEQDRYQFTASKTEPEIPDSVHAVISARIDRLPTPSRSLLLHASILGRAFPRPVLMAMESARSGDEPAVVQASLQRLAQDNLLQARAGSDLVNFAHPLIQEIAEKTLLKADRCELHRLAAQSYETAGIATQPGMLAHHWLEAGELGRALPYQIAAADRNRLAYDRQAIEDYHRALQILDELSLEGAPALRAEVGEKLGEVLLLTGDYPGAQAALRTALGDYHGDRSRDTAVLEARVLKGLAVVAQKSGRYDEALQCCREAIALSEGKAPLLAATLEAISGITSCYAGRFHEAQKHVQQGLVRLQDATHSAEEERAAVEASLRRTHGNALLGLGLPLKAADQYEAGLRLHEELTHDRWEHSIALYNLGDAYAHQGAHARAVEAFQRALEEKSAIGDRWGLAYTHHGLASVLVEWGSSRQALDEALTGLELAVALGDEKLVALLHAEAGRAHLALGHIGQARTHYSEAARRAEAIGALPERIQALLGTARIERTCGGFHEALGQAEEALRLAEGSGARTSAVQARISLGKTCVAIGRFPEADGHYRAALESASTGPMGLRFDILQAIAELHLERGEYGAARGGLEDILAKSDPERDRLHRGAAWMGLAEIHLRSGDRLSALGSARSALADFQATSALRSVARVHELLARLHTQTTEYAEAERHALQAIEVHQSLEHPDPRALGKAYLSLGHVHFESVDPVRMKQAFDAALGHMDRSGNPAGRAEVYRAVALSCSREQPEQSLAWIQRSFELCREAGLLLGEAESFGEMGEVYRRLGRLDEAHLAFLSEERLVRQIGWERGLAINAFHLASIHYHRGELSRAMETVPENIRLSERVGNLGLMFGLELRGQIQTELGCLTQAREDLDRALELSRKLGHGERLANLHRTRSEHFLSCDELEAAGQELLQGQQAARGLSEEVIQWWGYLPRERLAVMEARLALARGEAREVPRLLEPALSVFRHCQTPIPEVEALLVLHEAELTFRPNRNLEQPLRKLLARTRELGLRTAEADALRLLATLTADLELAREAHALALRIGTPARAEHAAGLCARLGAPLE